MCCMASTNHLLSCSEIMLTSELLVSIQAITSMFYFLFFLSLWRYFNRPSRSDALLSNKMLIKSIILHEIKGAQVMPERLWLGLPPHIP